MEYIEKLKEDGMFLFKDKYYDAENQLFKIEIQVLNEEPKSGDLSCIYETRAEFKSFQDFYSFLDGDIYDAKLIDYDFEKIDLRKYNIEGAAISSKVLISQGIYNNDYYDSLKKEVNCFDNSEAVKNEVTIEPCYIRPVEDEGHDMFETLKVPFFYVSDIHLAHRVMKKFEDYGTEPEIRLYIKEIVSKMVQSIGTIPEDSFMLIAGDTSSVFSLSKMFYEELIKKWNTEKIVVISGNHELWSPDIELEKNIEVYRQYFKKKGITYLQNELLYMEYGEKKILKEEELLILSTEEIRKLLLKSTLTILGGIGFSGLNEGFNAKNMRYGKSFEGVFKKKARGKEIKESNKFNLIYEKLLLSVPKNKVIVLTHMKKDDWNDSAHNPNWIYVNGHTHYNCSEVSEEKSIYADNQIGYRNESIGLKYFYMSREYNIFTYVEDGIHEITAGEYKDFYRGKHIRMNLKRELGTIYMIKKNHRYLFFIYCYYTKSSKEKKLYLLEGGNLRSVDRNKLEDLDYYYNKLDGYCNNIEQLLLKYNGYQKMVSNFIKSIGGSGKIHGCIIDVDKPLELGDSSYCHIYVNPYDGKVTPYYADDIKSRTAYKDIKTLLESQWRCRIMNQNYLRLEKNSVFSFPALMYSGDMKGCKKDDYAEDESSELYKVSKKIMNLQYCTEMNIVRVWNEELLKDDMIMKGQGEIIKDFN